MSRVVRIFEAFTPDESALTVSQISRRTGLHVATASRPVAELVSYGFLTRDADRRVRIGMRMWELATRASPTPSLRNAAMPFMEGVHDVVSHHVQLGVLDGDEVLFLERLSAPGADFPLVLSERYLFIAGGLGITPLLPMIRQAELLGADGQLLYGGGLTRSSMAFRNELTAVHGERVHIVPQDECGLLDLTARLDTPRPGTKVYCCGPGPLLAAVETACAARPP